MVKLVTIIMLLFDDLCINRLHKISIITLPLGSNRHQSPLTQQHNVQYEQQRFHSHE